MHLQQQLRPLLRQAQLHRLARELPLRLLRLLLLVPQSLALRHLLLAPQPLLLRQLQHHQLQPRAFLARATTLSLRRRAWAFLAQLAVQATIRSHHLRAWVAQAPLVQVVLVRLVPAVLHVRLVPVALVRLVPVALVQVVSQVLLAQAVPRVSVALQARAALLVRVEAQLVVAVAA